MIAPLPKLHVQLSFQKSKLKQVVDSKDLSHLGTLQWQKNKPRGPLLYIPNKRTLPNPADSTQ